MRHLFCGMVLLATLAAVNAQPTKSVQLVVSNETVPPNGIAQVKIFAAAPTGIASGRLHISFDPTVFMDILDVGCFSAAGDVSAVATYGQNGVDLRFISPSGSVGMLPGVPLATVTISIVQTATPGMKGVVSLQTDEAPWTDTDGNEYDVRAISGAITVGGGLSIANAVPGGGVQPAGTVVTVAGSGFDPAAALSVSGVPVKSYNVVSSEEVDFLLEAAADLTGKRIRITNPDGSAADYFLSLRPGPGDTPSGLELMALDLIFPTRTWTQANVNGPASNLALQNPGATPVDVMVSTGQGASFLSTVGGMSVILTVPPEGPPWTITASGPIQILAFSGGLAVTDFVPVQAVPPAAPPNSGRPRFPRRAVNTSTSGFRPKDSQPTFVLATLNFALEQSAPPFTQRLLGGEPDGNFSVSTNTGGSWLSAGPGPGTEDTLAVTVNPAGLAPGTYNGTVTITFAPQLGQGPEQIFVTLYVLSSPPTLSLSPPELTYTYGIYQGSLQPPMGGIDLGSNPPGVPFEIQTSGPFYASPPPVGPTDAGYVLETPVTLDGGPTATRPGIYNASITVTGDGASVAAPIKIDVTAGPTPQPVIGAVVDAGSRETGPISPGEIVTIFGDLIGPPSSQDFQFTRNGAVPTELAHTTVTFDGIAAPILYASEWQLNVRIPYGLPNPDFTLVQVSYFGVPSVVVGVPVEAATP